MTRPENIAAIAGENIELRCHPRPHTSIKTWKEYITNLCGQTIFIEDFPSDPPNMAIYSLWKPEEGDYHLKIKLLDISGGKYGCSLLAPTSADAFANVIVFGEFDCNLFDIQMTGV